MGHQAHLFSSRPVTISFGLGLFMMGLGFWGLGFGLPVLVLGIVLGAWGLLGWARDDYRSRFSVEEELHAERWPFAQVPKVKLAMWVFLGSEAVLFGVLLGSYSFIRFNLPSWPIPGSVHNITIGAVNTIILLTSSLTIFQAVQSAKAGNRSGLLRSLAATLGLGSLFIIIKGTEWYDLLGRSFTPTSGLPGSTFFITTGIHAAHIIAGLVVIAYLIRKTLAGGFTKNNYETVENFGLYWSLIDIVWIFIFAMFYLM
jgi:cytochrome c oxidase subunit I+III